jgi:hypothetical protein
VELNLFEGFTEKEIKLLVGMARREGNKGEAVSKGVRRYWDNISDEDYMRRCKINSESRRKWWASLSISEYMVMLEKNSQGQLRRWERMTPEEREEEVEVFRERMKTWREGLSPEELGELKSKISVAMKANWESLTEEQKRAWVVGSFLGGGYGQTEPERIVEEWLDLNRPGEYKYVGNSGDVTIGGKIPDFINVDGKKEVVEVFGMRWHGWEEVEALKSHYKGFGFDCKILWDFECYVPERIEEVLAG